MTATRTTLCRHGRAELGRALGRDLARRRREHEPERVRAGRDGGLDGVETS